MDSKLRQLIGVLDMPMDIQGIIAAYSSLKSPTAHLINETKSEQYLLYWFKESSSNSYVPCLNCLAYNTPSVCGHDEDAFPWMTSLQEVLDVLPNENVMICITLRKRGYF